MLVAEHILADGSLSHTRLDEAPGGVRLRVDEDGTDAHLPSTAVVAVMKRYGRPLDATVDGAAAPRRSITLGVGLSLEHLRFRARVDVEARDYLVLRGPGEEPLAALAVGVAAALRFLARRRSVVV